MSIVESNPNDWKSNSKNTNPTNIGVFKLFTSMLSDHFSKKYTEMSSWTLPIIIGAVIYTISPIDLSIIDLPIIGYLDDAVIVGLAMKYVKGQINKYESWRQNQI